MIRHLLVGAAVFTLMAGTAVAQPRIETAPIKPTPASDARAMYTNYCAVCHGDQAKGNGPAVGALNKMPADLTKIAARNAGTYPEVRVKRYIEGLDELPAHGTRAMPIWGTLFSSLDRNTAQIRIQALSDYLKSLQQ